MPGHEDAGPTEGKKSAEQQGSGRGRSGTEDISAAWRCGAGALGKELRLVFRAFVMLSQGGGGVGKTRF